MRLRGDDWRIELGDSWDMTVVCVRFKGAARTFGVREGEALDLRIVHRDQQGPTVQLLRHGPVEPL